VDWALRRNLPLAYAPDAIIYHKSGTSIGSHSLGRAPSPLSLYFKHRARIRFLWRFRKLGLIMGLAYSAAKAADAARLKQWRGAWAIVSGSLQIKPPQYIAKILK
jgi:GT2 family glycosyltransferase